MIETAAAALVPAAAIVALSRSGAADDGFRKAVLFWFVPLTLLWLAPAWLTGKSIAPFDYLREDVPPWQVADYRSGNPLLSDAPLQFLPWREEVRRLWLSGELPLVNRHAAAGAGLWVNPQAAVAFPLTLAGLPFSTFAWPSFAAACKLLLALAGMYLFLRLLGVSHPAAVAGSVAYAFCAFNVVWMLFPHTNVTSLLPLLMFTLERCVVGNAQCPVSSGQQGFPGPAPAGPAQPVSGERDASPGQPAASPLGTGQRPLATASFALTLAAMLAGGHPESVLHCAMLAVPYAAVRLFNAPDRRRATVRVVTGGVAGVLLAAPLLLPFAAYLQHSERFSRIERQREILLLPPANVETLAAFVAPGAILHTKDPNRLMNFSEIASQYTGLATLALALAAGIAAFRRNRFWVVAATLASSFAFASPVASAVHSSLPLADMTVHGRLRFVAAFCIAVLAARGIDLAGGSGVPQPRRGFTLICAILSFAAIAFSLAIPQKLPLLGVLSLAIAITGLLAVAACRIPIALVIFADLASLLWSYHPPVAREHFYPGTGATAFLRSDLKDGARVAGIGNALRPNASTMLGLADIGFHDPTTFEAYGALLARGGYDRRHYFNAFPGLPAPGLLRLLGVSHVVAPPDVILPGLGVAYRGDDAIIYRMPAAEDRAFSIDGFSRVSMQAPSNHDRVIEVRASAPARVVVSEAALPGWKLYRDGEREEELTLVSGALLGFVAPAGESRWQLRYLPRGFEAGAFAAIAGLLLVLLSVRLDRLQEPVT